MTRFTTITHRCDTLIIGGGGAGLRAAVAASQGGGKVVVASKVPPIRSHTVAAQGGINAALGNRAPDDWHWHAYDTMRGSDWLADEDAVHFMCAQAPEAVRELEQMGMPFTRDADGLIYQRAYGGQRTEFGAGGLAYRACAVADRTGHALLHTLYGQALRQGVQFLVEYVALDLVMDDRGQCAGVVLWCLEDGTLHYIHAATTILATGGFGQAYSHTTASSICTGDGGGMALRAGLAVADMEFIQFHPTSLYGSGVLITEGARGEGAWLLNGRGERFMSEYAPEDMELASRDKISRAMMQEIACGRGAGTRGEHLWLDVRHLSEDLLLHKLPSVLSSCQKFGRIDPRRELIPVVPAVHFTMGGIRTNLHSEVCPGLLAIGEAACSSVHGANRLGCNSLLELVIFGKAAGETARDRQGYMAVVSSTQIGAATEHFFRIREARGPRSAVAFRREMQQIMQESASIFRHPDRLAEGQRRLQALWQSWRQDLGLRDRSLCWNDELLGALETEHLLRQSLCVLAAANARTESRGAHFRTDYPYKDDAGWLAHSLTRMTPDGAVELTRAPLRRDLAV